MKSAYPKDLLDRYHIMDHWNKWKDHPSLQSAEFQTSIQETKNLLFMPPWWIRLGLFFACWLGGSMALGILVGIFFDTLFSYQLGAIIQSIVLGAICLMVNLHFIKTRHHFRSGLDDALIMMTLCFGLYCFYMVRESLRLPSFQWYTLLAAAALTFYYARFFIDRFVALVALLLFLSGIYYMMALLGLKALFFLPFINGAIGFSITLFALKCRKKGNIYLEEWLDWWLLLGMILMVISLQFAPYQMMFSMLMPTVGEAPFSIIFQVAGVLIPGLLLFWGIRNKERAAFWVGFLGAGYGLFTIMWQVWLWPVYACLSILGLLMVVAGYFLFRKLKSNEIKGYNLDPNANRHFLQDMLTHQIQVAMVIAKPELPDQPEMGEGKFGGAGASDSY